MSTAAVHDFRRKSDWCPAASAVALIAGMPQGMDLAKWQALVDALAKRLDAEGRPDQFGLAVDLLGDVHEALEQHARTSECGSCGGSGINLHNGARCIHCDGRGEVAA